MHEKSKLTEARHFLHRMDAERGNPTTFAQELSAFLNAARCVLQYTLKEAEKKPGGKDWYDQAMGDPLFGFFRELRNQSIHEMPVRLFTKFRIESVGMLNIGDDEDELLIPYPHDTIVHHFEFQDKPVEEVTDLTRQYLIALEALIEEGIAKCWISG